MKDLGNRLDAHHPNPEKQKTIDAAIRAGQGHVFRWWNEIGDSGRERLLQQLSSIDFSELESLFRRYTQGKPPVLLEGIEPAAVISLPKTRREILALERTAQIGEQALRAGEVAAFLVAGGQATRLGIEGPKGTFEITPVKKKTIFEHHVEKIRAASRRYGKPMPFYIMTGETNDRPTREFFGKNGYFGLDPSSVFFFKQDMMPALDLEGKLVPDAKDHIFTSPNGHGGSLTSLKKFGALADMQARGIKYISYFQVDNVLIKIADPVFIGHHIAKGAEMSAKVAPKRDPKEKVGVVCRLGASTTIIEYSDLPKEHKYALNRDGSLKFAAGNLAIHVLSVDFVETLNAEKRSLPFHIAEKEIPFCNERGELVKPKQKNGLKFERFVFDALGHAKETAIVEVNRDEEFAPIKNAVGEDSPHSALKLMTRLYTKWLVEAGARMPVSPGARIGGEIEISPLFALDADELKRKLPPSFKVTLPLYLGPE